MTDVARRTEVVSFWRRGEFVTRRVGPGISALAVIALGLGIGLTTAMFSIVNGVILRGLPFEQEQLLFNVQPLDVPVMLTTFLVLVASGLAASLVPARRAASIDPIVALRTE